MTYSGPFWEEHIPFELLDLTEDNNIEEYTKIAREAHSLPDKYLILSEMNANAVIVLDSSTDKVYTMNFEGQDEQLLKGELEAAWPTFFSFLNDYFNC